MALVRIPVHKQVYPLRTRRASARNLTRPMESYGLTRLNCGPRHIFESYPPVRRRTLNKEAPPVYFVPLDQTLERELHPLYQMLTVLHGHGALQDGHVLGPTAAPSAHRAQVDELHFALLLSSSASGSAELLVDESWDSDNSGMDVSKCHVEFLRPEQQVWSPRGEYVGAEGFSLSGHTATLTMTYADTESSVSNDRVTAALELATLSLEAYELHDPMDECQFDMATPVAFLSAEEKATVTFSPAVFKVVESGFKPAMATFKDAFGSLLEGFVSTWTANSGMPGLSDDIGLELTRATTPMVIQLVVPQVQAVLTDVLTPSVAHSLSEYMSYSLTKQISETMQKQMTNILGNLIPEHVDIVAPRRTARIVVRDLGHILCRSLTHTVVPALMHTMTHSPLSDWYCYYCFHKQQYCKYCNYAPTQVYFGTYYSGFYSTYYSDYYKSIFIGRMEVEQQLAEDIEKNIENERERWETVSET